MPSPRFALALTLVLATGGAHAASGSAEAPEPGQLNPAEVVQMVPGMPERGITMQRVRDQLGDPRKEIGPVGEPPITRWIYERFTVYFEHNRVLHSVKRRDR